MSPSHPGFDKVQVVIYCHGPPALHFAIISVRLCEKKLYYQVQQISFN